MAKKNQLNDFASKLSKNVQMKQAGNNFEGLTNQELTTNIPKTLDKIEEQIFSLQDRISEAGWHIGLRLLKIKRDHLDEIQETSIVEYAENKFGFKKNSTYRLMYVAENFTKEESNKYGSKLYYFKQLDTQDEEQIKQLKEWLENENPKNSEVEAEVKRLNGVKKSGRKKKNYNLSKNSFTCNLKKFGIIIDTKKEDEFLDEFIKLAQKFQSEE